MKKSIEKNNGEKVGIMYLYSLNDGSSMKEEAIEKKKKEYIQLYINTTKHEQDVRRWIESGNKKKGDIRRSLERLDSKYQELARLNKEFVKKGIYELKFFDDIRQDEKYNITELENKINDLYSITGEKRNTQQVKEIKSIYGNNISLVTDIPGNSKMSGLLRKNKNKNHFIKKLGRRVAAFVMAMSMALFAGTQAKNNNIEVSKNNKNILKSHTDINNKENEKKSFKESLYIEATEAIEKETSSHEQTENIIQNENYDNNSFKIEDDNKNSKIEKTETKLKKENKNNEQIEEKNDQEYLIRANNRYTERSNGSGDIGYFTEDTKVRIYNRALVKVDENGNKQILEVTNVGQTWEEFAKENNLDYNEFRKYMDNNKNIQKCVSLDSSDGTKSYGWVLEDTLEKIGEIER